MSTNNNSLRVRTELNGTYRLNRDWSMRFPLNFPLMDAVSILKVDRTQVRHVEMGNLFFLARHDNPKHKYLETMLEKVASLFPQLQLLQLHLIVSSNEIDHLLRTSVVLPLVKLIRLANVTKSLQWNDGYASGYLKHQIALKGNNHMEVHIRIEGLYPVSLNPLLAELMPGVSTEVETLDVTTGLNMIPFQRICTACGNLKELSLTSCNVRQDAIETLVRALRTTNTASNSGKRKRGDTNTNVGTFHQLKVLKLDRPVGKMIDMQRLVRGMKSNTTVTNFCIQWMPLDSTATTQDLQEFWRAVPSLLRTNHTLREMTILGMAGTSFISKDVLEQALTQHNHSIGTLEIGGHHQHSAAVQNMLWLNKYHLRSLEKQGGNCTKQQFYQALVCALEIAEEAPDDAVKRKLVSSLCLLFQGNPTLVEYVAEAMNS